MIPTLTAQDHLYQRVAHAESFGNLSAPDGGIERARLSHLRACQLGGTTTIASLRHLVPHVVKRGSLKDMRGVATRRIVTGMTPHRMREASVREQEGDAMRCDVLHSHPCSPVAVLVQGTGPRPASARARAAVNPWPEPVIRVFDGVDTGRMFGHRYLLNRSGVQPSVSHHLAGGLSFPEVYKNCPARIRAQGRWQSLITQIDLAVRG
jgi:hypothetical protein